MNVQMVLAILAMSIAAQYHSPASTRIQKTIPLMMVTDTSAFALNLNQRIVTVRCADGHPT